MLGVGDLKVKKVTRRQNIVVEGWAGASNQCHLNLTLNPLPNPPLPSQMQTQYNNKGVFFTFPIRARQMDGWTNVWKKPPIELCFRN